MKQQHEFWSRTNKDPGQEQFDRWFREQASDPLSPINFAKRFIKFCMWYIMIVLIYKYAFSGPRSKRDFAEEEYYRAM